jgi:hypothetical protein
MAKALAASGESESGGVAKIGGANQRRAMWQRNGRTAWRRVKSGGISMA